MILYLVACLWYIHLRYIRIEHPKTSFTDIISMTTDDFMARPFAIFPLPTHAIRNIFLITVVGGLVILIAVLQAKLRRHDPNAPGRAKLMEGINELKRYNMTYSDPIGQETNDGPSNIILSEDLRLTKYNWALQGNTNILLIGGSGSGKSYRFVGPNILQANSSYVITDPSGNLYGEYGHFLENMGYNVKCLNLSHMEKSNHYNPFAYIHSDKDIEVLVTTLIANTTPADRKGGDPFWEKTEVTLLVALIAYLHHYTSKSCQNFSNVMKLIRCANPREDREDIKSDLDQMFEMIKEKDPDSFAVKQYQTFKQGAGKTLKSILISVATRLQAFDLADVANLTDTDDIDLDSVGDEKTALFIIIPTAEKTFNFIASMLYSQLFQRAYDYCENTSKYSQLVLDCDKQLWKTYRATSPDDSEKARKEALAFFERAKKSEIIYNKEYHWYELRTDRDELVGHRGTKELAEEAVEKLKGGMVISNSDQPGSDVRMPVHVQMLMDEFANIGKVPDFTEKVSTIRKYEISVVIILQSIQQLENMYRDNWSTIAGNCDTVIYLGGGADEKTTKWVSGLIGKTTRVVMNTSYNGRGGSTSFNRTGVDLLSASDLRTMPKDEMVVIKSNESAFKGKKYNPQNHPRKQLLASIKKERGDYTFNAQKTRDLLREKTSFDKVLYNAHREIVNDDDETMLIRNEQKQQIAAEFENNEDINGTEIIGKNIPIEDKNAGIEETVGLKDKKDVKDVVSSSIETNEELWGPEEILFGSAPAQKT